MCWHDLYMHMHVNAGESLILARLPGSVQSQASATPAELGLVGASEGPCELAGLTAGS